MAGSEIMVQVTPDPRQVVELGESALAEKFSERVDELGRSLGAIANDLRDQLDTTLREDDDRGWALEELQLSFTLDLEAEAGVVIAKAKTAAGFEAALTWRRLRPSS